MAVCLSYCNNWRKFWHQIDKFEAFFCHGTPQEDADRVTHTSFTISPVGESSNFAWKNMEKVVINMALVYNMYLLGCDIMVFKIQTETRRLGLCTYIYICTMSVYIFTKPALY